MQTNLPFIRKEALDKFEENQRFFDFLKKFAGEIILPYVKEISENASSAINCKECANCCKTLNPTLINYNLSEFSEILNKEEINKLKENLYDDKINNRWIVKSSPCPLLSDNLCKVYKKIPQSCSEFPHIEPVDFKFRKISVINNYGICPIVYNTVEQLKEKLSFNPLLEN